MAWGVWNKIKNGFRKVGRFIRKGAEWVNNKIIKPFKPIVKAGVGALANTFLPGSGAIASKAVDVVSDGIDTVNNWAENRNKR